jgi:hypothetical protein
MSDTCDPAESWNSSVREAIQEAGIADDLVSGKLAPAFLTEGFAKFFVLRPLFVDPSQEANIRAMSQAVLSAHRKVLQRVLDSDVLKERHFSSLFEWTEEVLELDRPGPIHAPCLRFDGSLVDGRPVFFELNADMPQGIGLGDSFADFLHGQPFCRGLEQVCDASPVFLREPFLRALTREWKDSGGHGSPRVCFLTFRDEPVRLMEAELDRAYFEGRGLEAVVADPADLEYKGGSLRAGGHKVDLLYRFVSTGETLDRRADMKALIDAEKAGDVLIVNSFRSELMGNKAMFALLHEDGFQGCFTSEERGAISGCVPWTRVVRDGRCTDFDGADVDLPEWIAAHREALVLKPTHDFGGHSVTLGSQCDDTRWEAALAEAMEHDFIVQRHVKMGVGTYPIAEQGIPLRRLFEDIDPFMLRDTFSGCITRLSEDEMTNVHLHGAMGAVFEVPGS